MTTIIDSVEIFQGETNITGFAGYTFKTNNDGVINIKISNHTKCCEKWSAYASVSDESLKQLLLGAEITNIYIVEYPYIYTGDDEGDYWENYRDYIEIMIELSDRDSVKFTLKNEHNGYYAHDCVINWNISISGVLHEMNLLKRL